MKKRYVLALVISEQICEGDPNGNCCWITGEQREWALVDDFETERAAEDASRQLHKKYDESK